MKCLQHHFSQLYDYLNTTIEYLEKNLLHKIWWNVIVSNYIYRIEFEGSCMPIF